MSQNKAIQEFKDKYINRKEIDHVVDYLTSVYPYKKRFNFSYEQAVQKANNWTKKLNKKNKDQTTSGKVETILEFDKGFKLVRLIDQDSKNWEGIHMGHCVSSYKDHEGIYSIRDRNNIPKCTIEIEDNYVNQIKGKANGEVAPAYIDYVLKSLKYFNYEIDSHEIENIGYLELNNNIKESFTNLKIITIDNQEHFYTKNKLKLSKNPKWTKCIFNMLCGTGQSLEYLERCLNLKKNDPSSEINCAIRFASRNGHYEVVKLLLKDKRVDPSDADNFAIGWASRNGHYEVVKLLLKDKRVNPADDDNYAIIWASVKGHLNVVELLLKDKRVNPSDYNNYAIRLASANGHYKIIELLLQDKRVDPSDYNNEAIRYAHRDGHDKIVELLLKDDRVDSSAYGEAVAMFPRIKDIRS